MPSETCPRCNGWDWVRATHARAASIAGREGVGPLHRSSTMIAHTRRARAGSGAGRHVPRIPLSLWRHSRIKAVMDA